MNIALAFGLLLLVTAVLTAVIYAVLVVASGL